MADLCENTIMPLVNQTESATENFYFPQQYQGRARTQSPTTTNYAVEIPTFEEFARVSTAEVQWLSLALGEPPS